MAYQVKDTAWSGSVKKTGNPENRVSDGNPEQ